MTSWSSASPRPPVCPGCSAWTRRSRTTSPTLVTVGEPASPEEIKTAFGVDSLPVTEVTPEALLAFNRPEAREVGVPGGGGVMRASDLALYYQALLHNPGEMWKPDVLADVTSVVRNRVPERWTGIPANRSLGLILAGDDGYSFIRGLGRTVSPRAVRPQRRRRAAGVGRSRHRAVARLLHQRPRPARRAGAAPRHGHQQPGRHLRELTPRSGPSGSGRPPV